MCNEAELCFGEETWKQTNTLLQIYNDVFISTLKHFLSSRGIVHWGKKPKQGFYPLHSKWKGQIDFWNGLEVDKFLTQAAHAGGWVAFSVTALDTCWITNLPEPAGAKSYFPERLSEEWVEFAVFFKGWSNSMHQVWISNQKVGAAAEIQLEIVPSFWIQKCSCV